MKRFRNPLLSVMLILLGAISADATTYVIQGHTYVTSSPTENLTATFTQPDGGVTANRYEGYVLLHVTGGGDAGAQFFNDAFYYTLYGPVNQSNGSYQLGWGARPLTGINAATDAKNFLVYDGNANKEVRPPYVPAYTATSDYTFVIATGLTSPSKLHFDVLDDKYSDNSGAYQITVTQLVLASGALAISTPNIAASQGSIITFTATLQQEDGTALSNALVFFNLDGHGIGLALTDSKGTASLPYKIAANATLGAHTLTVAFEGDAKYEASQSNGTLTVLTPSTLMVANQSGTVAGTVPLSALLHGGTQPLSGKTLTFTVAGIKVGTAVTDGSGTTNLPYTIPDTIGSGAKTVLVSFAGGSGVGPTLNAGILQVAKATPTLSVSNLTGKAGSSVALMALCQVQQQAVAARRIAFQIDGATVQTALTGSNGTAEVHYTLPTSLKMGTHTLMATFAGDNAYNSVTSNSAILTVN